VSTETTAPRPGPARQLSPEPAIWQRTPTPSVLLAAVILLAFALRFWRLGAWTFAGDEIFTLRDSLHPELSNPRPLLYFLNYYLVRPFLPLNELGLRLLPATFGVLTIPAFYYMGRRLVGTRAALFGTLLLAVNSFNVYQSQFARYWSLVFLLSAVYPFAIYLGLRERNGRILTLGLLTGVLATLAHPVSVLLVGGLALWLLLTQRDRLAQMWSQKSVRWGTLLVVLLVGAIGIRYIPLLRDWIMMHDAQLRPGDNLLHLPGKPWVKQIAILLSFADGLTLPLVLASAAGIYLLWQGRDRPLAVLLMCLFLFPLAFILLLSFRTAVSTTYLLTTAPIFFIGAGVFLDRLAELDSRLRPKWLLSATVAGIIIVQSIPTLISQYRDGRRNDFRSVAHWLSDRLAPGDIVFSDQYQVLMHYLGDTEVQPLRGDPAPLRESARELGAGGTGGTLWIVAPVSSRGGHRTNPKIDNLKGWIYSNCQLRNSIGVARLDFRQNELQIYRCPPELPARTTSP
jgi:Dolichyl-phosphate-mannose-protein mannosyltransferase